METQNKSPRITKWIALLLWLVVGAFFIYTCLTILDLHGLGDANRQTQLARILTSLCQPNFQDSEVLHDVLAGMWETFQIAFLATVASAVLAVPFTILSARPAGFFGRAFNILLQPILSIIRSVHPLFTVIFCVVIAGIGPTAGVLVLTVFSTAVLIGIFSDYAAQRRTLKWSALCGVHFPGLAFKHLPVNLLIASILGIFGGGGIGLFITQNINLLAYQNVSVAFLACILLIGSLDLISRVVWRKILRDAG